MRRVARLLALCLAATCVGTGFAAPAHAASSQAVVIIDTGGSPRVAVISFSGTISGFHALELAGANPETYGFAGQGAAICRLDHVGNDPSGSSCLGTPDDPRYWAYYRAPAGSSGWKYSASGAGVSTVSDGDVEGWRFGTGGPPRFQSFCDVVGCAPPPAPANDPAPAAAPGGAAVTPAGGPSTGGGGAVDPTGASGPSGSSAGPTAGDPGASDSTPPTTALGATANASATGTGRNGGSGTRALGPITSGDGGGGGGSGSPVGVVVAAALVALIGAVAIGLRRRSRTPG